MELAHWAHQTERRLGLTKRAPLPGAGGTQVLTYQAPLRSATFLPTGAMAIFFNFPNYKT